MADSMGCESQADYAGGYEVMEAVSSSIRSLAEQGQYNAFGMLVSSTGSTATPFGFAGGHGYQTDGDSGLMLLGHRYYDASAGRFLTRDVTQDGRNWYDYCENNPITQVDPAGQSPGAGGQLQNASRTRKHRQDGDVD